MSLSDLWALSKRMSIPTPFFLLNGKETYHKHLENKRKVLRVSNKSVRDLSTYGCDSGEIRTILDIAEDIKTSKNTAQNLR